MADEKVLLVRVGMDLYAIPIKAVEEVLPSLPIESMPKCPDFVRGVVFVRGHLIPVLDAGERLGSKTHSRSDDSNIVCLRIKARLVGVEFDEVLDLLDLVDAEILPSRDIGARDGFFTGVVEQDGRLIRMLDPDKLTTAAENEEWHRATL